MFAPWHVALLSPDLERRQKLGKILAASGIEYVFAANMDEFREVLASEGVGLVFCDNQMPKGVLRDLFRTIRSLNRSVKIVVLSGTGAGTGDSERLEAERNGAFGVIPFPYQPTDVEWIISRAVRAQRKELAAGAA